MNDNTIIQPLNELLGLADDHIDAMIIRELTAETLDAINDARAAKPTTKVWLDCPNTLDAVAGRADQPTYYHRADCQHLNDEPGGEQFTTRVNSAERVGFQRCPDCWADISSAAWALSRNVCPDLVDAVLNRRATTITKTEAVALLKAVGEAPHPDLLAAVRAST